MKKILKWTGFLILFFALAGCIVYLIYLRPFIQDMKKVERIQVDEGLIIVTGGGGNSGIILSDSLVVLIDTKQDEFAEALAEEVKALTKNRSLLVINTHWHPDHVGGNHLYRQEEIMAGGLYSEAEWKKEAGEKTLPGRWLKRPLLIPMKDDTLLIYGLGGPVHTPGDLMVYLKKRKVLFGGDVILNKTCPILLGNASGEGYIEALADCARMEVRTVVPGHGAVGGPEVISDFLWYFEDVKMAAYEPAKKKEVVNRYAHWKQIPFVMSPGATISHFEKVLEGKK
jgi:glyoxylase-like metal-dependent hydrolase (beta-lactamase superfamily II)